MALVIKTNGVSSAIFLMARCRISSSKSQCRSSTSLRLDVHAAPWLESQSLSSVHTPVRDLDLRHVDARIHHFDTASVLLFRTVVVAAHGFTLGVVLVVHIHVGGAH